MSRSPGPLAPWSPGPRVGKNLAGRTFVPRFIWFLFWLGGTLTAMAIGGRWLILRT
jgi:hypothetical protein